MIFLRVKSQNGMLSAICCCLNNDKTEILHTVETHRKQNRQNAFLSCLGSYLRLFRIPAFSFIKGQVQDELGMGRAVAVSSQDFTGCELGRLVCTAIKCNKREIQGNDYKLLSHSSFPMAGQINTCLYSKQEVRLRTSTKKSCKYVY